MPYQNPKGEPVKGGDEQISSGFLNKLREGMPRQIRGAGDVDVEHMGDRLLIRQKAKQPRLPDSGNYYAPFVIRQEFDDYLLCTPFQQPVGPTNEWVPQGYDKDLGKHALVFVYVAKPYVLQKAPWNDKSVNTIAISYGTPIGKRTLTDVSGATLTQEISSPYGIGEVITAKRAVTGLVDPSGIAVAWQDENAAAREWTVTDSTGTPLSDTSLFAGPVGMSSILSLLHSLITQSTEKYEAYYRTTYVAPWGDTPAGLAGLAGYRYALYAAGGNTHSLIMSSGTVPKLRYIALPLIWPSFDNGRFANVCGSYITSVPPGKKFQIGVYSNHYVDNVTCPFPSTLMGRAEFTDVDVGMSVRLMGYTTPQQPVMTAGALYWLVFFAEDDIIMATRDPDHCWPVLGFGSNVFIGGLASGPAINIGWVSIVQGAYANLPASMLTTGFDMLTNVSGITVPLMGQGQSGPGLI